MLILIAITAASVYIVFVLLAFALQTKMVFPGGRDLWCTPAERGWDYEEVTLDVGGEKTDAWLIPVPNSRGMVLFSHGNAGTIADRLDSIEFFRKLGLDVFIYDYGGYGKSSGKPSEKRCYADVRAAWRYLTQERGIAPSRILLFGRSLGGAVTADLAAEVKPGGIILESTFLAAGRIGKEIFPWFPVRLFLRYRFDTASKIGRFRAPLLMVHSPEDELIPYHHGKELFELAPEPKQFLEIHGPHSDGFWMSGEVYGAGLAKFLDPLFPANGGRSNPTSLLPSS